ncbi:MAG TPA: DUF3857 domain-containing protein [Pyrinomonadaceae bacterium]|nr:DUF3857 domain-containing protein [Pyrinomonadaceae bacterium]HMP64529.1 DUF3857 domain-containing protein [Pyrinomonadaceae bacterium]
MLKRSLPFLFCLLAFAPAVVAKNPPAWLSAAAKRQAPQYARDVPAVVLHSESRVVLESNGRLVTTENYAVRLLNREGRSFAVAQAYYLTSAGRVRDIEAWSIRPNGSSRFYDKKTIIDIIADRNDVYNEGRLKIIDASREVDAEHVFGYTIVSEDTPLFYQDIHRFQGRLPVLVSRYALTLPQGWQATSTTFNHPQVEPQVSGTTYTWELNDLKPIPPEPMSPSLVNLAPRIAVNYAPADPSAAVNRAFADWLDVSRWASGLYDPQVVITPEIIAKAKELTANAKTELEKIRAIGHFVQNLQYISIDIGVGHGNGYKPRPSNLVLSRGYGDCKDKANLMRALLKTLDIEAYPIAIYSGDPTYVKTEWASPRQFNHCIIAVRVSSETDAPTVIEHERLGRLLIFDATDTFTPVGDLPDYLQGSHGLIIAGEKGGLSQMPVTPPDVDLLERTIEATLDGAGQLVGTITERANGQTSTIFRREIRELSVADYRKAIEGWLTRGATGARLVDLSSKDIQDEAAFHLEIAFETPRYGQLMRDRLLVFKPVVVGRRNAVALTDSSRQNPVELEAMMMRESVVFTLPEGFEVDEIPDEVDMESEFGRYSTKFKVKEGKLHFERSYQLNRSLVPPDRYDEVRKFFARMLDAEQSAVVLMRR